MDAIQPVGAMIQPPNPQQGLNAYSTLLGLQHQKVGLEQQQQELSQQTSQATVAAQNAKETQAGAQLLSDPVKNGILDADGNVLPHAQDVIMHAMPTTGAQRSQQIIEAARAKVGFQSDVAGLSDKLRGQVGAVMSADAAGNASREQTVQNLNQLAQDNPQAAGVIIRAVAHLPQEPHSTGNQQQDDAAMAQHRQALNQYRIGFGRAVTGAAGAASYNDVSTQGVNQGTQVGLLQTTKAGQVGNAGSLDVGMQGIVTPPGGVPTAMRIPPGHAASGGGGGANQKTARNLSGFPGPQPTDQDMKNFGDYEGNLNARAAAAADTVPRINLIEQAIHADQGGGGSTVRAKIAQKLQAMNAPKELVDSVAGGNLAGMQEAEKMLFQTTLAGLKQSMQGDASHVAQFQAASAVFPNVDTDPRARQRILGFIRDQSSRDFAEQDALADARRKGTFNPVTWQDEYHKSLRGGQVPGVPKSQVPSAKTASLTSKSGRPMKKVGDHYEYDD